MALDPVQRAIIHGLPDDALPDLPRARRVVIWGEALLAAGLAVAGIGWLVRSYFERALPQDPRPMASIAPYQVSEIEGIVACLAALVVGAVLGSAIRSGRRFWAVQLTAVLLTAALLIGAVAISHI